MPLHNPSLEISTQRFTSEESTSEPTLHLPLTDLEDVAPSLKNHLYRSDAVSFPFSNDECTASYFEQLAVRKETSEYKAATNRVAVLIGESGLAANLKFIPEETIVLLDESPDMNIFMERYVEGLRTASSAEEWYMSLTEFGPWRTGGLSWLQVNEWSDNGRPHPLVDDEAFYEAQKIARQKTIVTWNADITDSEALANLAKALDDRDASITMMNLTNVLPYTERFRDPRECAAQFYRLPLTPNAPIITTGIGRVDPDIAKDNLGDHGNWNVVTGPFFGLDNLAAANTKGGLHQLGSIVERNIMQRPQHDRNTTEDLAIRALLRLLGDLAKPVYIGSIAVAELESFLESLALPDSPNN